MPNGAILAGDQLKEWCVWTSRLGKNICSMGFKGIDFTTLKMYILYMYIFIYMICYFPLVCWPLLAHAEQLRHWRSTLRQFFLGGRHREPSAPLPTHRAPGLPSAGEPRLVKKMAHRVSHPIQSWSSAFYVFYVFVACICLPCVMYFVYFLLRMGDDASRVLWLWPHKPPPEQT